MKLFNVMTDKYYWLWREEKKKTQEAEETLVKALAGDHRVAESDKIIVKKMEEIEQLKADLARAKEDHQYDNLVHQKELEDFRKGRWDPNFKPLDGSER